jgi:hypothetical protein
VILLLTRFGIACFFDIGRYPKLMFGSLYGSGSWNGLL